MLREPVPVGEGIGPERRLQPATERPEPHVRTHAVIGLNEPPVGVTVPERPRVLVRMEGARAMDGMAQEGEAEILPGLGTCHEDLVKGPVSDQLGARVDRAQGGDDAA